MTSHESGGDPAGAKASRPRALADLPSAWRPLKALQKRMDDDIAAAYTALHIEGVRPRFSMAVMFLQDGPLSISDLAQRCGVTQSAMSQSVAAMRSAGLVESESGEDARSRVVSLTSRGNAVAPQVWSEWYATEAAIDEVAAEAGVALDEVVARMRAALDRESFTERLLRLMRAAHE